MVNLRLDNWRKNWWVRSMFIAALLALIGYSIYNIYYQFVPIEQLSRQASEARLSGRTASALFLYRIISARASHYDYSSNFELGNIYAEQKKYRTAEHYYLKAAVNPSAPVGVYYNLSDLYLNHLKSKVAKFPAFLEQVIKIKNGDVGVVIVLADFYKQTGDRLNAIKWYELVLQTDPGNAAIQSELINLRSGR